MPSPDRWIHGTALLFGAIAWVLAAGDATQTAAFPTTALAASAWIALAATTQRAPLGADRAGATTLGALCLGPLVFFACLAVASEPVAFEATPQETMGLGDRLLLRGLAAFAAPVVLWRSGAKLAHGSWYRLVATGDRAQGRATAVALVAAASLVAFAGLRSLDRPPFDRPLDAALRVTTFSPLGPSRASSGVYVHPAPGIELRARCEEGRCQLRARVPAETSFIPSQGRAPPGVPSFASSASLTLYQGPGAGLWVVTAADGTRAAFRPTVSELPVPVTAAEVASRLAPPRSWVAVAAAGLVLALWLARRASRERAQWRDEDWCEATLGHEGLTLHDDQRTFPLAPGAHPVPGPVLVSRRALDELRGAYRDAPSLLGEHLRAGTLDDLRFAADSDALVTRSAAVVVAALTAAPLVAARAVGF